MDYPANNLPFSLIELQRTNRPFFFIVLSLLIVVVSAWVIGFVSFPLDVKIYSLAAQVIDSRSVVAIFEPSNRNKIVEGNSALFQFIDENGMIQSVTSTIIHINPSNGEVILKTDFTNDDRFAVVGLLHGVVIVVVDTQTPLELVLQSIG